jgi:hypothetical protein
MHPLIAKESALRTLPARMNRRQRLFIDSIRFAIEMADTAYNRLAGLLARAGGLDNLEAVVFPEAFIDAWAIVDSVSRLRKLLDAMPIKRKSKWLEYRSFMAGSKEAQDLRDAVQHMDERINEVATNPVPLWGVLRWVAVKSPNKMLSFGMAAGTLFDGSHLLTVKIGTQVESPVDRISLSIGERTADLSQMVRLLPTLVASLEKLLAASCEKYSEAANQKAGSDFIFGMEVEPLTSPE